MPGYFASNALPSFSPTGRSIAEYRITLASLVAAAIRSGVIAVGSGAAARSGLANTVRPRAAEPLMTSRRLRVFRIASVSFDPRSDVEDLQVACLDLFALFFGALGVFLHQLDL